MNQFTLIQCGDLETHWNLKWEKKKFGHHFVIKNLWGKSFSFIPATKCQHSFLNSFIFVSHTRKRLQPKDKSHASEGSIIRKIFQCHNSSRWNVFKQPFLLLLQLGITKSTSKTISIRFHRRQYWTFVRSERRHTSAATTAAATAAAGQTAQTEMVESVRHQESTPKSTVRITEQLCQERCATATVVLLRWWQSGDG